MIITGRIFDILILSEKSAQIVLRKKLGDKIVPVAVEVYGYWKDKALNELKLKPKDKIKANIYLKSKMWKDKYYTDVFFKEIIRVDEYVYTKLDPMRPDLFQTDDGLVDTDTGEVIE